MKPFAAIFSFAAILASPSLLATECKVVASVFQLWNGWPPSLRLKDAKSGTIYGVNENTPIPNAMKQSVTRNGQVTGKFCLTVVGHTTVPYHKELITLVHVVSYSR
jgi:hypothetical protein